MMMTIRQAIRVLIESPLYFRMRPAARRELLIEFCRLCNN